MSNGKVIENFLNVDKNRLHMECVGAVIALDDKTKNLDKKIGVLENRFYEPSMRPNFEHNKINPNASKLYQQNLSLHLLSYTQFYVFNLPKVTILIKFYS
jgi:hypothetical protein